MTLSDTANSPATFFGYLSPEAQEAIAELVRNGCDNEHFVRMSEAWSNGRLFEMRAPWDRETVAKAVAESKAHWAPHLQATSDHSACEYPCPESDFLGMRD